jgi:hypothetical protein
VIKIQAHKHQIFSVNYRFFTILLKSDNYFIGSFSTMYTFSNILTNLTSHHVDFPVLYINVRIFLNKNGKGEY